MSEHTCDASSRNNGGRTASAKTISNLIMHRYDDVTEGLKANDVIQIMKMKHVCEISKFLAWYTRKFAINVVKGILEKSFGKFLKYLHMLREANLGIHTIFLFCLYGRCSQFD